MLGVEHVFPGQRLDAKKAAHALKLVLVTEPVYVDPVDRAWVQHRQQFLKPVRGDDRKLVRRVLHKRVHRLFRLAVADVNRPFRGDARAPLANRPKDRSDRFSFALHLPSCHTHKYTAFFPRRATYRSV